MQRVAHTRFPEVPQEAAGSYKQTDYTMVINFLYGGQWAPLRSESVARKLWLCPESSGNHPVPFNRDYGISGYQVCYSDYS